MRRRNRLAAVLSFHRHSLPQVAVDAGLVALAYYLAFELRFDGEVTAALRRPVRADDRVRVVGGVFVFALFGLYRHWMRYATQRDYLRIAQACVVATLSLLAYVATVQPLLQFDGVNALHPDQRPGQRARALRAADARVHRRLALPRPHALRAAASGFRARRDARSVLIVGAGDGGRLLLREIIRNPDLGLRPVGFVDDDPRKQGARIDRGLSVLGTTEELPRCCSTSSPTRC